MFYQMWKQNTSFFCQIRDASDCKDIRTGSVLKSTWFMTQGHNESTKDCSLSNSSEFRGEFGGEKRPEEWRRRIGWGHLLKGAAEGQEEECCCGSSLGSDAAVCFCFFVHRSARFVHQITSSLVCSMMTCMVSRALVLALMMWLNPCWLNLPQIMKLSALEPRCWALHPSLIRSHCVLLYSDGKRFVSEDNNRVWKRGLNSLHALLKGTVTQQVSSFHL